MTEIAQNSGEQKLIISIFELISKLGYNKQPKFDKVTAVEAGVYRLTVDGSVVSYHITYDPINKKGLLFGEYLENVTIHMVGVNQEYRECSIKILFCNPKTTIREYKWYILKTNKESKLSRLGLPWLKETSFISTDQALALLEVLTSLWEM